MSDTAYSTLNITSTIGNLNINGNFTPVSFIAAWDNSYRLVTEAIAYRFQNLDSLRSFDSSYTVMQEFRPTHMSSVEPMDVQFHLQVKDFKPLGIFIHVPLTGYGFVEGGVVGDSTDLQFSGNVDIEQFGVRSGTDTLFADSASLKYFFDGIDYRNIFKTFNASIETELQNFKINDFLFNQISGQIKVESDQSDFQLSAFIDSTARVDLAGISRVNANLMEFELPELKVEIGQYLAENSDTVRLALGRDGIRVNSLMMMHEAEEAAISGYFSPSGISDLTVSLKGFLLSELKQILHKGPYARSSTQFGGIMDATTNFRGSFDHPNIILNLQADGVRADDSLQNKHKVLGRINSNISYFEHLLSLSMRFMSHPEDLQTSPDLLLFGSLPYEFVLARETPHKLDGEVDLTLKSTGMNLEFLDPFIPEISNLSGMMMCDMHMKGPIDAPLYEGSMTIQNAGLVFDPLGIRYILNGDLIPAGNRIQLERFTIQNDPQERFHVGSMKVSGSFTLHGLNFKRFDLLAQGDLKIMSEEKRLAGQKIYGNLFAATGPNGIEWKGDLSASTVRGEMLVKDAQLVLPPERETELVRASVVNVTFKDDTSRFNTQTPEVTSNNGKTKSIQIVDKLKNDGASSSPTSEPARNSFLDGISYDIGIETQGPTQLRFVFNTQTAEELFADLQGRLYFNRNSGISKLTGQVEVSNRSYYKFIKQFDATGKLLFTGDVLNPELDVTATHQGTHSIISSDTTAGTTTSSQLQSSRDVAGRSTAPQVMVTLQISGTRNEPKTKISLQTKAYSDKDWSSSTNWKDGDDEANAISFILAGQFRNELTDQQRMGLIGTNVGLALASSMLTGTLSEAARKATYGVVQSVDMLYYGGQFGQAADLRLTGQVGEAVIRAGGRVFTGDIGNTNVSVELPMSYVLGVNGLRNLIITLERRVEGIQSVEEQRRASNGARLFYRITF
jgi:hypothetical protein